MACTIAEHPVLGKSVVLLANSTLSIGAKKIIEWRCSEGCGGTWKETIAKRSKFTKCPKCEPNKKRKALVFYGSPVKKEEPKVIECNVCCDTKKGTAICPACKFECCTTCLQTYIMSGIGLARCMNTATPPGCSHAFSASFLINTFGGRWYEREYRDFQTKVIMEREQALFPSTMPLIDLIRDFQAKSKVSDEAYNKLKEYDNIHNPGAYTLQWETAEGEKNKERRVLIIEFEIAREEMNAASRLVHSYPDVSMVKETQKLYIQACPKDGCRGMIGDDMICGVCYIHICGKCRVLSAPGHQCKEEDIATAKEMAKNTKPCPSCAAPIYKISGCDQMWCVMCKNAFSWSTGRIENGAVHNPHYFDWLTSGRATARVDGDECVLLPRDQVNKALLAAIGGKNTYVFNTMRSLASTHLARIFQENGRYDNILYKTRAEYIMGDIDYAKWSKLVMYNRKHQERSAVISEVARTFHDVLQERIRALVNYVTSAEMCPEVAVNMFDTLTKEMAVVRDEYNAVVIDANGGERFNSFYVVCLDWTHKSYSTLRKQLKYSNQSES